MHRQLVKTLFILFLMTGSTAHAEVDYSNLDKEYKKFKKIYQNILELSITNKQAFIEQFDKLYEQLKSQQTAFEKIEGDETLTEQGNQIAFDIEALKPLEIIAQGKASTASCQQAQHNQSFNIVNPDSNDPDTEKNLHKIDLFLLRVISGLCTKT
ncbi:MAG: hypothetical protein ACK4VO_02755 [Pseudobdellovibrio sp.]